LQLFDLLGFDQFEFIQDLLTKRRDIVQVMLQSPSAMGASAVSLFPRDVEVKPNYGAQVTIQVTFLTKIVYISQTGVHATSEFFEKLDFF